MPSGDIFIRIGVPLEADWKANPNMMPGPVRSHLSQGLIVYCLVCFQRLIVQATTRLSTEVLPLGKQRF